MSSVSCRLLRIDKQVEIEETKWFVRSVDLSNFDSSDRLPSGLGARQKSSDKLAPMTMLFLPLR